MGRGMQIPFQVDRFHINNLQSQGVLGDRYSGFSLEDQQPVVCLLINDPLISVEQLEELKRVNIILAQKEHENVLRPLAFGGKEGRPYLVYPDFGRPLSQFENLKALPPAELLVLMRGVLRALLFAESKEVLSHQSVHPDNIRISLEQGQVKLGFFGYPTVTIHDDLALTSEAANLLAYLPPRELLAGLPALESGHGFEAGQDNGAAGEAGALPEGFDGAPSGLFSAQQCDLYGLGLIALELATATPASAIFPPAERLRPDRLRQVLSDETKLPLPVQELLYKLLSPVLEQRYGGFKQALDDVQKLCGEEQSGLRFQTFILDTLINGRFKLVSEIGSGRVSRIYSAIDTRSEDGQQRCVVKLVDLRSHPELQGLFQTRFKALPNIHHENVLQVYDVGIHFENGYIAMESGLQSLEQLLIKRGTLPMPDAGRIVFQICKGLEGLYFHHLPYHGALRPSNIFLTTDLRSVKIADPLVADAFLQNGNLNFIGAEYYTPEFIRQQSQDQRSDIYQLGILLFEMMVGHPPFCFKVEQEIRDEHLHLNAATRVEASLLHPEIKDMLIRMLEKNPTGRYAAAGELGEELSHLLGYDKKQQVQVPNLRFDFAELSMVGKNTREKGEETLAIRLPAVNNRARGAIALLVGHGNELGDSSRAATSALKSMRELLFSAGAVSPELAKMQKTDPEKFLDQVLDLLNQRLYREAFGLGKTGHYGLSAIVGMVQENTLYLHSCGEADFTILAQGHLLDHSDDKWTINDEVVIGDGEKALSNTIHDRLGFGELARVHRLKRRLKDGDQLLLLSRNLSSALSISEIKELITSTSEPAQAMELIKGDAIRRRLEGTISCVLLGVGNTAVFAEEGVSHSKKGLLARNFLAQGDTFLNDSRIDEAIEQYNQALQINPNFAILHHQLGVAYKRKGLFSYSQSCFDRALELNSKLAASYIEIVDILRQLKRQREVLPLLRKAVAEGCRDADLYALLGRELLAVRNYDEAILYCSHALELNPQHGTAFRDRMLAVKRRGALDTKLLKMLVPPRARLSDDGRTRIHDNPEIDVSEEDLG
ncbi:protein kinase [bacterium]|nr:protein kinase [bacterium]